MKEWCLVFPTHLVDIVQTDVQVVLHSGVLHLVFLRGGVGPHIERLRSKGSISGPEIGTETRAKTTQAGKWVLCLHTVHAVVEK